MPPSSARATRYAPICTDCHSPHAVMAKAAYDAATGAPCSKCHDPVFDAYAGSVHGKAAGRGAWTPGVLQLPPCPRRERRGNARTQLKNACLGCHPARVAGAPEWLPNAERHLRHRVVRGLSCAGGQAQGRSAGSTTAPRKQRIAEKEGVPQFERRARASRCEGQGPGRDGELQSLLREFNREGMDNKTTCGADWRSARASRRTNSPARPRRSGSAPRLPPSRAPTRSRASRFPSSAPMAGRCATARNQEVLNSMNIGGFGRRLLRHRRHPDQDCWICSSSSRCWAASACRSAI